MHYDNSRDESQVNASMDFIKMHETPFCYDAVSCSLECYLVKNLWIFSWIRQ